MPMGGVGSSTVGEQQRVGGAIVVGGVNSGVSSTSKNRPSHNKYNSL